MRERLHRALEDFLAGVADGIYRVSHAVNQAFFVKHLLVEQLFKIVFNRFVVCPVGHILLQVLEHLIHLDVGAAVLGTLQGSQRRRNCRIGVGAGGGDHMRCKGGVVAAAVLHVQNQRHVQHLCLELGILAVGAQQRKDNLRGGHGGLGVVNVKALVVDVVVVGVIAVHRQQRKYRNQLNTLAQHVADGNIVSVLVIAEKRQHAARDGVHHILAGRFEDNVAHKVLRQRSVAHQQLFKIR